MCKIHPLTQTFEIHSFEATGKNGTPVIVQLHVLTAQKNT